MVTGLDTLRNRNFYLGFSPQANTGTHPQSRKNQLLNNPNDTTEDPQSSLVKRALSRYRTKYDEAKRANEERYQRLLGLTDEISGQRASDIRTQYEREKADVQQRLAGLGMADTTVAPTMKMGYEREKQDALNRASDEGKRRKMKIVERRQDAYPDPNILMGVLKTYGRNVGA